MAAISTIAAVASAAMGIRSGLMAGRRSGANADTAAALADPFAANRPQYQQRLSDSFDSLTNMDPSALMRDPQFAFLKAQGLGAINASMAGKGKYNSGNTGVEGARFAEGLSSNFLQNRWSQQQQILQMLAGLSGANTGNPGAASTNWGMQQAAGQSAFNNGWGNALGLLGRTFTHGDINVPGPMSYPNTSTIPPMLPSP